jgi:prevent-host-death family protein
MCYIGLVEQIGIRELRQRASEWVAKAKAGAVIVITDRGQPVAKLAPLAPNEHLRSRLIADGELIPATAPRARFSVGSLVTGPPLTPILDELRADR